DGLASQLLGYVGEIGADQLKQLKSKGYQAGDVVGRDGVEAAYESVLRGKPRRVTVQVDPTGKQIGPAVRVDPGTVGDNVKFTNDNGTHNGSVNLQRALTVSSDVYFYNAGNDFWKIWKLDPQRGLGIQHVASQLGFGQPTGIELGDATGRIPDPAWKAAFANANYKTAQAKHEHAIWYPADNIFASVGQGDEFVTPLPL